MPSQGSCFEVERLGAGVVATLALGVAAVAILEKTEAARLKVYSTPGPQAGPPS